MFLPARSFNSPAARAALWAGVMVFLTAGYFVNRQPGWNVNSQFALTCALVERGTFSIDAYHAQPQFETGDKAFFNGHYYSDKSPVTSLLGTVPLALYKLAAGGLRRELTTYDAARYWTTWLTAGLAAALVAALTALLLTRHGVAPARAARAGALWVAATPLLGYSTIFFNYAPACALALGGFLVIERLLWNPEEKCGVRNAECGTGKDRVTGRQGDMATEMRKQDNQAAGELGDCPQVPKSPSPQVSYSAFFGGVLLGLAAWTLNTMGILCLVLTAGLAWASFDTPAGGRWRAAWGRLWPWALGGLAGAAGYFVYTLAVFHSLSSPYAFESSAYFREQMGRGFMGASWPRPLVMMLLTFHPYLGLFVWFPLALAALIGLLMLVGEKGEGRREAVLALAAFALLLAFNSGYYMWWGGWASVPRHLIPALALMGLGLVPWLTSPNPRLPILLMILGIAGMVVNWGAVAYSPQHFTGVPAEFLAELRVVSAWPSPYLDSLKRFWLAGQMRSPNWGTLLGLEGQASLLPLAAIWAAGWWLSGRIGENEDAKDEKKQKGRTGGKRSKAISH